MRSRIQIAALATLLVTARTYGQYYAVGDPFSSTVSAQSLGMGGVGTAFLSDNATATIANPAQLGIFSLSSRLNAATDIAGFPDPNQPIDFSAVNIGITLNRFWPQLPIKTSLGIGYSNVSFTYLPLGPGPVLITNEIGTFNGVSAAVGFDYYFKVGFGYTLKWINLPTWFPQVKHTAEDFGALLQIPVGSLVCNKWERTARKISGLEPSINLNLGYAMRNYGSYLNNGQMLPTEAKLGWSIDAGLGSEVAGHRWQWFSIEWSQQAGTFPVRTDSTAYIMNPTTPAAADTTWIYYNRYENGLKRFGVWQNLVIGRASATVGVARGGQIGLGEFLYLRAGDITYAGSPTAVTFGWGLRLDGLIKCLVFLKSMSPQSPLAKFLMDHIDLEYDFGKVNPGLYNGGQKFEDLNLLVR